ncbi:MAG: branched-chain amino acid aminotransferase [Rhodospirillaceae bacterium]|jgi:branched-chain amino acid aminotransferase|nr:branched-chain amino acid aminotransferase [Rhodospirillaceae bacterium]MBT5666434.1 branched-chain amino acid aminotransferase [Rhodospirillaceae bacterium]MBT5811913.1 branched-chain amino acid aminotransferase [Rhodospirillaceae bacterium]
MDAITYLDGKWIEGNPPLFGSQDHATWLASVVFDGARTFDGVAPDLDLHCARTVQSARALGLNPTLSGEEILELAREGIAKFPSGSELYIRPMFWAESGWVDPDPETTRFSILVYLLPMPDPVGFSACLSDRRRPAPDMAPTDAKAACLYPNSARALREAAARGFKNAVMRDPVGNVAEFATANLFLAKDGVVHTPTPNGTFLNGITRQRIISLYREKGVTVAERTVTVDDVYEADELFCTGNQPKVLPVIRYEDRDLQPGPLYKLARELYWEYAHKHG